MKNYNTKEFLRIKRGYEQAALLLAQRKYKPALTALKRPIHSLEYGSEKTLFLAKCYELEYMKSWKIMKDPTIIVRKPER